MYGALIGSAIYSGVQTFGSLCRYS